MSPLDDFRALLAGDLPVADAAVDSAVRRRPGLQGLGRLVEWAAWWGGWTGKAGGRPMRPVIALYAACATGDGPEAAEVRARLEAVASGEAAVSRIAQSLGAGLEAFDLALDRPTGDVRIGPAMSEREAAATLAFGMEALAKSPDLLLVGRLGGPRRGDLALDSALHDDLEATEPAAARAREAGAVDPLDLIRQLGGRDTAAMAGAILAARVQRTPVVLDGYAAAVAAAALQRSRPDAIDHCLAAQVEHAQHRRLLDRLGLPCILDLQAAETSGAASASALALLLAACAAAGAG